MGLNIHEGNLTKLSDDTNYSTFSLTMTTSDSITANVIHDRLLKAIQNLGDQADVDLKITSSLTTRLSNSPF